jgi:Acetyltransferase (GNAT) domain
LFALRNFGARVSQHFARTDGTNLSAGGLCVERHDGIIGLQSLADELDLVNAGSVRPSPFATSAFTITYASHSERDPLGMDVRLFVVRDRSAKALGWAVFAFRKDQLIQVPFALRERAPKLAALLSGLAQFGNSFRLEVMTTSDVDRPGVVALRGSEDVVASALLEHLIEHELDWTMLEWRAQEPDSPLWKAAHKLANPFLRVRDVELDPYSEVQLQWPDLAAYFRALSKRMRSNVSRQARRLYAAGDVELIMVDGAEATAAFFDAYQELESRSWKHHSAAAMGRHPLRRRFYSRIVSGEAGIDPSLIGITLDGVLIAALINGRFGDRMWSMEMAFDESLNEVGPGQLLLLLAVMDGLNKRCRSLNFFQLHGYFKRRWLADEIPVANVQLLRRPSLHDLRGLSGDALRWAKAQAIRRSKPATHETFPATDTEPSGETGLVQGDDDKNPNQSKPSGGYNPMKRAADGIQLSLKQPVHQSVHHSTQPSAQQAAQAQAQQLPDQEAHALSGALVDSIEGRDEATTQRRLLTLALQRACGRDGSNEANVHILDVKAARAILPFTIS